MGTNNYFKVGHEFFFFDDTDARSTHEAFEAAQKIVPTITKARLSVFRQTRNHLTMYLIGASPDIGLDREVTSWTATGWTTQVKAIPVRSENAEN